MTKALFSVLAIAAFFTGCGNSGGTTPSNSSASEPMRADKLQSTTVHTTEGQATPPAVNETAAAAADEAKGGKFSAGGNPIDLTDFNKKVADTERAMKAEPKNADAKQQTANAYFERGFALTEARQYAAALRDLRKALELDPQHAEAKKWEKQIIGIYEMMKKEYPKPGEEPDPLPFTKKGA